MKNLVSVLFLLSLTSCLAQVEYVKPIPDLTGKNPAIMKVYLAFLSGVGECTATLVSDRVAVTAAHCLTRNGQSVKAIMASPNYSWGTHPNGLFVIDRTYTDPCYIPGILEDPACDFALIVLKKPAPKEILPMTVGRPFSGKEYEFTGYAGNAYKQVDDIGLINVEFGIIRSKTLAIGGMSGGPIHDGNTLVGLITMSSPLHSVGVPITPERMKVIKEAIEEAKDVIR